MEFERELWTVIWFGINMITSSWMQLQYSFPVRTLISGGMLLIPSACQLSSELRWQTWSEVALLVCLH